MRFERPPRVVDQIRQVEHTVEVRLRGDFELSEVERFERAVEDALGRGEVDRVIVDLGSVDFIDLAAIRSLLRLHERGRGAGYEVRVVKPRGPASRIFTLTRLGQELAVVDAPPKLATG